MASIWEGTAALPVFPPLTRARRTDLLIIGGGITGLLCASLLTRAGASCVLVEAGRLCGGVTRCTTAKLTAQHGLIYSRLLRTRGPGAARLYLSANLAALGQFRTLGDELGCPPETRDSFVYSLTDRRRLEAELAALRTLGFPAELREGLPLPIPTAGAICFPGQAQLAPLKFLAAVTGDAVARGLRVYENTPVRTLRDGVAQTPGGELRAGVIIVATHFPFLNRHGSYFLKLYQERSYVLALEGAEPPPEMYVDEAPGGLSLREQGGLLLLGGAGGRTGKPAGGWQALEEFARTHWPRARVRARFAAQDCMSLDGMPYIGQYSARTPGLYTATGYNKWGMTSSMTAAMLLTDLLSGRENPAAALFSPSRSILRPQLAVNALESLSGLLTPTGRRCPHLGCALKWNPQEHSWDCSCHGSRFGSEGELLDGPATGDLGGGSH